MLRCLLFVSERFIFSKNLDGHKSLLKKKQKVFQHKKKGEKKVVCKIWVVGKFCGLSSAQQYQKQLFFFFSFSFSIFFQLSKEILISCVLESFGRMMMVKKIIFKFYWKNSKNSSRKTLLFFHSNSHPYIHSLVHAIYWRRLEDCLGGFSLSLEPNRAALRVVRSQIIENDDALKFFQMES